MVLSASTNSAVQF